VFCRSDVDFGPKIDGMKVSCDSGNRLPVITLINNKHGYKLADIAKTNKQTNKATSTDEQ